MLLVSFALLFYSASEAFAQSVLIITFLYFFISDIDAWGSVASAAAFGLLRAAPGLRAAPFLLLCAGLGCFWLLWVALGCPCLLRVSLVSSYPL